MPGQQGKSAVTRSSVSSTDTAPPAWAVTIQDDLSFLKGKIDSIPADIAAILEPIKSENIKLSEKVHDLEDKVRDQQCDITYLKSKCQSTSDRLIRMEAYSMRENLVLTGIEESEDESESSLIDKLMDIFQNDMDLDTSNFNVVKCHRLYKPKHSVRSGPRDVIVRFTSQRTKSYILSATGKLKDRPQPLYINEQYPREIEQRRRILRPALKAAKAKKLKASMVMDKLIIKGTTFTVDNLGDIPVTKSLGTTHTENHILFHGRYSPYSNFYSASDLFHDDSYVTYCSSEQFYQRMKALHLGSHGVAAEIMNESDPAVIKSLGDSLSDTPSNTTPWADEAPAVMEKAVLFKFRQNKDLLALMKDSGSLNHVECNKFDTFWGIGLPLTDSNNDDPDLWRGKNTLGKILDQVRDVLTDTM